MRRATWGFVLAALMLLALAACSPADSASVRPSFGPSSVTTSSATFDLTMQVSPLEGTNETTFTALLTLGNAREEYLTMVFPNVEVRDKATGDTVWDWETDLIVGKDGTLLRGYRGYELAPGSATAKVVEFQTPGPGTYEVRGAARDRSVSDTATISPPITIIVR